MDFLSRVLISESLCKSNLSPQLSTHYHPSDFSTGITFLESYKHRIYLLGFSLVGENKADSYPPNTSSDLGINVCRKLYPVK